MKVIPLTRGYSTTVDDEDFARLCAYRWVALVTKTKHKQNVYAYHIETVNGVRVGTLMHQLLMGFPECLIDHKDGNGVNNCRGNLRRADRSKNAANALKQGGSRHKNGPTTSRFKGVHWHGLRKRWVLSIKGKYIGLFYDECDAATAYNFKALELFGEFAKYNEPLPA